MRVVATVLGLIALVLGPPARSAPPIASQGSQAEQAPDQSEAPAQDDQGNAAGAEAGTKAFLSMFEKFGFRLVQHVSPKNCSADSDIEESVFLESIPALQRLQMLNPDLTQTKVNAMPRSITFAFGLQMAPAIVQAVYNRNADVNSCVFNQFIDGVDDYGNTKRTMMFSFHFTRALFKKVNWDGFEAQNLPKIAPQFRFGPAFMQDVEEERGN